MFHVSRASFGRQGDMVPSPSMPADSVFSSRPDERVDVDSSALLEGFSTSAGLNPREQKLLESMAENVHKLNSTANALRRHLLVADEIESNLSETGASKEVEEEEEQERCAKTVKAGFDDALAVLVELTSQREQLVMFVDSNKFFAEELRRNLQDDLAREKDKLVAAETHFIRTIDLVLAGLFY